MGAQTTSAESIRSAADQVLGSSVFQNSARSRALLKFIVDEYTAGRVDRLKEYTIGVEALGRGDSFDPRTDPIVRAEASRLRDRLDRYYATEGQADSVMVLLPKGSYIPQFVPRPIERESIEQDDRRPSKDLGRVRLIAFGLGIAVILIVCAFLAGYFYATRLRPANHRSIERFDVALTSQGTLGGEVGPSVVFSPDGARVVFVVADKLGVAHLHSRRLDQSVETELPGTEGARVPFFSPDGHWVGFWAGGKVKKTNVEGGSPVVLCETPDLLGASWGSDGRIVAAFGGPQLMSVPSDGGATRVLVDLAKDSETPRWPQLVDHGREVIFTAVGSSGSDQANITILSLDTGKTTVLVNGGTFGRLVGEAVLTYVNQGTLFAVPFDSGKLAASGSPVPVVEGVSYSSAFGYAEEDISMAGDLVYRKYRQNDLVAEWVGPRDLTQVALPQAGSYLWPRLSHDGKRMAVSVTQSGESKLLVSDLSNGHSITLPLPSETYFALWTPNDRFLILGSRGALLYLPADGTGKARVLLQVGDAIVPWSFSPDGSRIAYYQRGESTGLDLWTLPVHVSDEGVSAEKPELFRGTKAFEAYPTFSPDGHWIAYTSNESGNWYIYVRSFPDNGKEVRVSNTDGRIPFWFSRKNELLYRTDDQRVMAVDYSIDHGIFVAHRVQPWSPVRLADTGVLSNLDFDAARERFIGLRPSAASEAKPDSDVTFVLHFAENLVPHVKSTSPAE